MSNHSRRKVYESYPIQRTEFFEYSTDSGELPNKEDVDSSLA